MTQGKLEGLVALVTAASTGIGKATAISFSKEGAKVVIAARGEDKLKEVADEITSAGGEAVVVAGDISKKADCKKMVDTAVEKFGALHVAFNNAGVFKTATFADMTKDSVDSLLDVNVKSLAWCFKYQIPAMASTAGGKGSIIVNTSGTAIRTSTVPAMAGVAMYAATKAAAEMLMKYAAIEGAPSGVRVNSVLPGHVETPGYGDMPVETLAAITKTDQLIARPIQPEEIAKVVIFLASEDTAMDRLQLRDGRWLRDQGLARVCGQRAPALLSFPSSWMQWCWVTAVAVGVSEAWRCAVNYVLLVYILHGLLTLSLYAPDVLVCWNHPLVYGVSISLTSLNMTHESISIPEISLRQIRNEFRASAC